MKFYALIVAVFLVALCAARAQQSPEEQYIAIYIVIQQGDTLANAGQPQQALKDYTEAQTELLKFQKVFSDWNPHIVNFRLNYLADKIAALTPQTAATPAPQAIATNVPPQIAAPAAPDLQPQIDSLNQQLRQLQSDNETLQDKLKEALGAQPATVSADELTKAQQEAAELAKENSALRAAAAQSAAQGPAGLQSQIHSLKGQVRQLQSDNEGLEKSLKQEKKAGAGMVGADQFARAREEAWELYRENQSLKAAAYKAAGKAASKFESRIALLDEQIRQLQSRNDALVKTLKTAKARAGKTSVGARELAQAQDEARKLAKENDLLQASLAKAAARPTTDLESQIASLNSQIRLLQADNETLETSLNQARQAQGGMVGADELAKAQEQARELARENQSLKAAAAQVAASAGGAYQSKLASLTEQISRLEANNETLEAKLREAEQSQARMVGADELAMVQKQARELARENQSLKAALTKAASREARQNKSQLEKALAAQDARVEKLSRENESLQARVKSLEQDAEEAEALRAENAMLKKQIAAADSLEKAALEGRIKQLEESLAEATAGKPGAEELARDREQIKELQTENELLRTSTERGQADSFQLTNSINALAQTRESLADANRQLDVQSRLAASLREENESLEEQLKSAGTSQELARITQELDALKQKYALESEAATAHLSEAEDKNRALEKKLADLEARMDKKQLQRQIEMLEAKVAALEEKPAPFTPEELALFRAPEMDALSSPAPEQNSDKAPSAEASDLVDQARELYSEHRNQEAEQKYLAVLKLDKRNTRTLVDLATIEIEMDKTSEAELYLNRALDIEPKDAHCLAELGNLRLRQGKFEAALDALSQAAQINPNDADIQNFLGVALAKKGMRIQAEAALRKAIILNPQYGSAHINLAVIYATQHPPKMELARWHYQKALDAGSQPNPELEKILAEKGEGQ